MFTRGYITQKVSCPAWRLQQLPQLLVVEVAPARGAVEDQRCGEGHAPDVPRADGAAAGGAWGLHHGGESREMPAVG